MKALLHRLYVLVGTLACDVCLLWWTVRDRLSPPGADAVLFVAHPDDDTLFFHTFIREHKPYVCLMTTGWSLRRMPDFRRCMRQYGVRYRAYPLDSRDTRMHRLEKQVSAVIKLRDFRVIATHNAAGEYGHEEHIRVHEAVMAQCGTSGKKHKILCPVNKERITDFPLDEKSVTEKLDIFATIYTTESWVPFEEEAGTPVWVRHEKLEELRA